MYIHRRPRIYTLRLVERGCGQRKLGTEISLSRTLEERGRGLELLFLLSYLMAPEDTRVPARIAM